jgi:hypothetical protein
MRLWEKLALGAFFLTVFLFGVLVEVRSAFLQRRMGDLGVFLRAAWAVRTGADFYAVTDANDWHYSYPPLFAILLVPLADPPQEMTGAGYVPFAVSVALWYAFSIACLAVASHALAAALERRSDNQAVRDRPAWSRGWWRLRLLPVLFCLPPIGGTLMRGQVNLLVLALLAGMVACSVSGRRFLAGMCVGVAACIKIFPVFLLVYALWRRDSRFLGGAFVAMILGLLVVPGLVLGPARTADAYAELTEVLIRPALHHGTDQSRAKELIEVTATDSQSLLAVWHNLMHLDQDTRPDVASPGTRRAHWIVGGMLLALTLLAGGRMTDGPAWAEATLAGMLNVVMILVCPVCHLHYFCLALPLAMGLMQRAWETGSLPVRTGLALAGWTACLALPHFPGMYVVRDAGLATYGTLALWTAGLSALWQARPAACGLALDPARPQAAAPKGPLKAVWPA